MRTAGFILFAQMAVFVTGTQVLASPIEIMTEAHLDGRAMEYPLGAPYTNLPMHFERNCGQADPDVEFLSHIGPCTVMLRGNDAVLAFPSRANSEARTLRMVFSDTSSVSAPIGHAQMEARVHYLIGNEESQWVRNVPVYGNVRYESVLPGVDLVFYGNRGRLEYDFHVSPNADPSGIRLRFEGSDFLMIDEEGALAVRVGTHDVRFRKPICYQRVGHRLHAVRGRYILISGHEIGFDLGSYDRSRPLIIDPVLEFSTYFGGLKTEAAADIQVDSGGYVYIAGNTGSTDLPRTDGAAYEALASNPDAFIAKFSPDGSSLLWCTYFGGTDNDGAVNLAIAEDGTVAIAGWTRSTDLPMVRAYQSAPAGGTEGFIARMAADGGSVVFSTYLGGEGSDNLTSLAIDRDGDLYVTGFTNSVDFPLRHSLRTANEECGPDAFVTKLHDNGVTVDLVWSTLLGGSADDRALGIDVDSMHDTYVVGQTVSNDFPATETAVMPGPPYLFGASADGFVSKLRFDEATQTLSIVWSSYLGTAGEDICMAVAVDQSAQAHVTGYAGASGFPLANEMYGTMNLGGDAFVTKFSQDGTFLHFSTYLGGNNVDEGHAIAVDNRTGDVYVGGSTLSNDFPILDAIPGQEAFPSVGLVPSGFVTKFDEMGVLEYSTYLGGTWWDAINAIAVGPDGHPYAAGATLSENFPVTSGAYQAIHGGISDPVADYDAFIAKIVPASEAGSDAGMCAMAFLAAGTPAQQKLAVFRRFRDEVLNQHRVGRVLVEAYYAYSPLLIAVAKRDESIRSLGQRTLVPLADAIELSLASKHSIPR